MSKSSVFRLRLKLLNSSAQRQLCDSEFQTEWLKCMAQMNSTKWTTWSTALFVRFEPLAGAIWKNVKSAIERMLLLWELILIYNHCLHFEARSFLQVIEYGPGQAVRTRNIKFVKITFATGLWLNKATVEVYGRQRIHNRPLPIVMHWLLIKERGLQSSHQSNPIKSMHGSNPCPTLRSHT